MDSAYVDLAIGLALAFFLLSLLVSAANEALARVFGVRAKFLWASLRDLLEGPAEPGVRRPDADQSNTPNGVLDIVSFCVSSDKDLRPGFAHLPPRLLDREEERTPADRATETRVEQPPASLQRVSFVDDLHDRLSGIDVAKTGVSRVGAKLRTRKKTSISQIPPPRLALAMLELVDGRHEGDVAKFLTWLKDSGSPFAAPFGAMVRECGVDRARLKRAIEGWFDSEMTRLTAVYRRNVRWIISGIAVIVTAFIGFDSLGYAGSLLADRAGKEQLVAVSSSGKTEQLRTLCAGTGSAAKGKPKVDSTECFRKVIGHPALADAMDTALVRVKTGDDASLTWNAKAWWKHVSEPGHLPGMFLTVLALLFGAPFWWEAFRRLLGMRTRRPSGADSA